LVTIGELQWYKLHVNTMTNVWILIPIHSEIIVEKVMVVVVLSYDPNHVYYFQKLTTDPELIEQRFSDSWSGTSDRVSKIIRGLY
jgi:hypothetical protein